SILLLPLLPILALGPLLALSILLLALLAVLALLSLLTLLIRVLLRALTHAIVERLEAAHEIARLVRSLRLLPRRVAALRGLLRLLQPLPEVRDVAGNLLLIRIHRVLLPAAGGKLLGVAQLLLDLPSAERVGRTAQRLRQVALIAA